jgi:hypothetical protein
MVSASGIDVVAASSVAISSIWQLLAVQLPPAR